MTRRSAAKIRLLWGFRRVNSYSRIAQSEKQLLSWAISLFFLLPAIRRNFSCSSSWLMHVWWRRKEGRSRRTRWRAWWLIGWCACSCFMLCLDREKRRPYSLPYLGFYLLNDGCRSSWSCTLLSYSVRAKRLLLRWLEIIREYYDVVHFLLLL